MSQRSRGVTIAALGVAGAIGAGAMTADSDPSANEPTQRDVAAQAFADLNAYQMTQLDSAEATVIFVDEPQSISTVWGAAQDQDGAIVIVAATRGERDETTTPGDIQEEINNELQNTSALEATLQRLADSDDRFDNLERQTKLDVSPGLGSDAVDVWTARDATVVVFDYGNDDLTVEEARLILSYLATSSPDTYSHAQFVIPENTSTDTEAIRQATMELKDVTVIERSDSGEIGVRVADAAWRAFGGIAGSAFQRQHFESVER